MSKTSGASVQEEELYGCQITTVDIKSKQAAKRLNRAVGRYITIQTPTALNENVEIDEVGECLAVVLAQVLRPYQQGKLCICGMGNHRVQADSLGPEVVSNLPLKFFSASAKQGSFSDVYAIAPGTEMANSVSTEIIVGGLVKTVGADCVLLVDSSMTNDVSRLFQSFQLSTNGGIDSYTSGQKRDWSSLGVPVVSLCVPTAIPLSAICPEKQQVNTMLTGTNIQDVITAASFIVAYAILRVCWPSLSKEECFVYAKCSRDPIPYSSLWLPKENNVSEEEHNGSA